MSSKYFLSTVLVLIYKVIIINPRKTQDLFKKIRYRSKVMIDFGYICLQIDDDTLFFHYKK